ncbi:bifunctional protein-serine/threonine kinase/phosphatase [Aliiglaciecola lipolytica]|uniref:bifunctional protein-serine/threonine kinase/phosphatase n=1 Tax=Aliiglaciecola lipolytica TaxID=477689 RepID=UPI001C0896A2|nr:bifunctional protein-serine/threonine kinase/phosphatase [Aliiglaciecola lipolytica]MBU2876710.1 protein kinase [Aliiglaciecola lipolytica]
MQATKIVTGQYSSAGRKVNNQDFCGFASPTPMQAQLNGFAAALADGISSSQVSHIASQAAVNSFLHDYYSTSDAWSVETSAKRVITSINAWLFAHSKQSEYRYDPDKGYVCTFAAVVIKGTYAHLFHVGDSRIYLCRQGAIEQLTNDHQQIAAEGQRYLSRALGMADSIEIDHQQIGLIAGDILLLCTDGFHDFIDASVVLAQLASHGLVNDGLAERLVNTALENGSNDNITVQLLQIQELSNETSSPVSNLVEQMPLPPPLHPGCQFDGFNVVRQLHYSARSHVYLVNDIDTGQPLVLKTPSVDLQDDDGYLERFCLEEWISRRIHNVHVLKAPSIDRPKNYLYTLSEFVEGQSLQQWLTDNPTPDLVTVRDIIEQVGRGLQAFHRLEMLHQDIRPENIMIDQNGTVKIIDFGSTMVAGIEELDHKQLKLAFPGTALYMAPEYFLGEVGTQRSDLFSLAVLTYYMLSGRYPYETHVAKTRTFAQQRKLNYQSVLDAHRHIPSWVDASLRKALQVDPYKRYDALSEFIHDLRHPNPQFLQQNKAPLLERSPLLFWQWLSALLAILNIYLFYLLNN